MAHRSFHRRVSLGRLFYAAYWVWRNNAASILPTMLQNVITFVLQIPIFVGLGIFLIYLLRLGVLKDIASLLREGDFIQFGRMLVSPPLFGALITALVVLLPILLVISVVGYGFTNSAEYRSYHQLLREGHLTLRDVLLHATTRWKQMAWTVLASGLVTFTPMLLASLYLIFRLLPSIGALALKPSELLSLLPIFLAGFIGTGVLYLLTMYSVTAAAVDEVYGFRAVIKSIKAFKRTSGASVGYIILVVGVFSLIGLIASVSDMLGLAISSLLTVGITFSFAPILNIVKTEIYLSSREEGFGIRYYAGLSVIQDLRQHVAMNFWNKFKTGVLELKKFAFSFNLLPYHMVIIAVFICGVLLGDALSSIGFSDLLKGLGIGEGRINPELQRLFPPSLGVDLFFHNWFVSLSTGLSGLAFGVPTVIMTAINGVILGLLVRVVPSIEMFYAAILPHGVIEIPSFILAGSSGLRLGISLIKALAKGEGISDPEFQETFRSTLYILIGLSPLYLIGGLIESVATPSIMKMNGWR